MSFATNFDSDSSQSFLGQEIQELNSMFNEVRKRLDVVQEQVCHLLEHTQNTDSILDRLNERDSSLWLEPTRLSSDKIPPFIPISQRPVETRGVSTRFLSFINLKGGVGKTTISANLAAAFAAGNYKLPSGKPGLPLKILIIDLDFQGTLSQRCVSQDLLQQATNQQTTSARLLTPPKEPTAGAIVLSVPFIHQTQTAQVVTADEKLDQEDFKQQAKLALKIEETRYQYRNWFHKNKIFHNYDLILFDCPPRLTSSTVCSLVASDFVFIPTAPDSFDIPAANRTINWIGRMQKNLNLSVRIAGIILNRTNKINGLSSGENSKKIDLDLFVQDFLLRFPNCDPGKRPVILNCNIPRRAGENDQINGKKDEPLPGESKEYFNELATEVFERIF